MRRSDALPEGNNTIVAQLAELVANLDHHGTETTAGLRELIDSGARHVAGCEYAGSCRTRLLSG
jgi:hypothetical protein